MSWLVTIRAEADLARARAALLPQFSPHHRPTLPVQIFYQIIDNRVVVFRVLQAKQEQGGGSSQPEL